MAKLKASPKEMVHRTASAPTQNVTRPGGRSGGDVASAHDTAARRAGPSTGDHIPKVSDAAWGVALGRLASAVLIRPAATMGRILVGSKIYRAGGYRRHGYPEIEYWMAGHRYPFDN